MDRTYFKFDELHNPITHSVEGSQDQITPIKHSKKHECEFRQNEPHFKSETDTTPGLEEVDESKEKLRKQSDVTSKRPAPEFV